MRHGTCTAAHSLDLKAPLRRGFFAHRRCREQKGRPAVSLAEPTSRASDMSERHFTYDRPTFAAYGYAVESLLVSVPAVCFTLALVTDVIYWRSSYLMW